MQALTRRRLTTFLGAWVTSTLPRAWLKETRRRERMRAQILAIVMMMVVVKVVMRQVSTSHLVIPAKNVVFGLFSISIVISPASLSLFSSLLLLNFVLSCFFNPFCSFSEAKLLYNLLCHSLTHCLTHSLTH